MANVSLSTREYGDYVVIALQGELDIVDAASVMAVLAAAAAGNPRIIVDLAALEFIDCGALAALGRVRAQARQAGGDLLLAEPRGPVRRLLDLTGLMGVFSVHASVEEAVRAAGGSRLVVDDLRFVRGAAHGGRSRLPDPGIVPRLGIFCRPTTFPVPDAEPEAVLEAPAASATASLSTRWHEIQAKFVDDPRASAELAAGLADESIQALVAFVNEQHDSLLAAWHDEDAGTE
jgi:anti-sigma B factor antagonist